MGEIVWTMLIGVLGVVVGGSFAIDAVTEKCMTYHEKVAHVEAVSTCKKIMYGSDK